MHNLTDYSLFTDQGERKYLNSAERQRFYECTLDLPLEKRLYCQLFHYTGARLNEISLLQKGQIDYQDQAVILRTLKQRRKNAYRQIPLPEYLLNGLYDLSNQNVISNLWTFSSRTGARCIKAVMDTAEIRGVKSNARGIRHGYAVHAASKAPLTQVQKWLGHAFIQTTAIYLNVSGREEREWAEKVWR